VRPPSFVLLGAGALGSIIGAHLARAGHPVSMVARGRRAAQIRAQGLRVRGLVQLDQAPIDLIEDPRRCPDADALIVCTKALGTRQALERLREARFGAVLSLQNGVLKNELLAGVFGPGRVLGAIADTSGELTPEGEVLFTRNECIAIGALARTEGEPVPSIVAALRAAGIASREVDGIEDLEWCKFVAWVPMMVLSVTTRACTPDYLEDPGSALFLLRLVREMGALARACGVELSDAVTLPVATLCSTTEPEGIDLVRGIGRALRARAPRHRMSSLQDLVAGRPLELEETVEHGLHRAHALGMPMPLVSASYALITGIDRIGRQARLAEPPHPPAPLL
jgi:2-dehydropantoate 2-reductase